MSSNLANLIALLSLDNSSYLQGLDASKDATSGFTGGLAAVGGAVVVGGLTAAAGAVTAVGIAAWDAGDQVNTAMDTISVATGATGEQLAGLRGDFERVFTSVPTDADRAANAIGILNSRLDISGPALQNTSASLLEMSRITGGDLTTNGESFTRMVGDWGLSLQDLPSSMDKVFVASQETGAEIGTLMQQIVQYGAPMRNFGFSFEESGALLAGFAAQGVNTEIVMSGLRTAQGKFIAQGKDMSSGLWETIDAIQNAETQTEALGIATNVFGAKAAGDWLDTIRGGKFDIDEITNAMMNSSGAIMAGSAATLGWAERWGMFQNRVTTALAPLGTALEDAAVDGLSQIVAIFERPEVQQGMTTFATMAVQGITAVVTHIPTLINVLLAFVTFLQQNEGIVVGILAALGLAATIWGVVTAAAAWTAMAPLLPVIAVLALVAAGAYLLYLAWTNNFGGIQDKVAAVWAFLQPIFVQIKAWFERNIPVALEALSRLWTSATTKLSDVWTKTLWPGIQAVWGWMSGTLFPFLSAFFGLWLAGWNLQLTAFAGVWKNVLWPALQWVGNLIRDYLVSSFERLMSVLNFLSPIASAIGKLFGEYLAWSFKNLTNLIQGVTNTLDGLAGKLKTLKLPDWLTPGSPTPWEIGLWGIGDALDDLARKRLPSFSAELQLQPAAVGLQPTRAGVASAASAQGPVMVVVDYRPLISTADEAEAQGVLAPILEAYLRGRKKE